MTSANGIDYSEETYDLFGDGFRAAVTCPFGPELGWRAYRNGSLAEKKVATGRLPEDVVNGCYEETAAFIRGLREGSRLQPSIEDVYPSVELCFEAAKMVESQSNA